MAGIDRQSRESYWIIADHALGRLRMYDIPHNVTQPGGWASDFAELLAIVTQKWPTCPQMVILTGGGSRMPFIRELCQAAFPEADIVPKSGGETPQAWGNPSLSVAYGLASAGSQRVRIARFRHDVRDI